MNLLSPETDKTATENIGMTLVVKGNNPGFFVLSQSSIDALMVNDLQINRPHVASGWPQFFFSGQSDVFQISRNLQINLKVWMLIHQVTEGNLQSIDVSKWTSNLAFS